MSLPYPPETETGKLGGPPPPRGAPLSTEWLVAEAIYCQGDELYAFGHALAVELERSSEEACHELRATLVHRMEQRLPFAEEEHWARLVQRMKAQLDDGDTVTHAAHLAASTVDSM